MAEKKKKREYSLFWAIVVFIIWTGLLILFGLYINSFAQIVGVKPAIKGDNFTVGDRFLYTNTIALAPGEAFEPLAPEEGKLGDADVLSQIYRMPKPPAGAEVYACTLAVYKPGEARIPTLSFRRANSADTSIFSGDTLTIQIASVLPADTAGLEIADIKGPRRLRGPIWPYLVALGALALLLVCGSILRSRWRKTIETPQPPSVPPWELAMQRLDSLKAARHLDFGRFKEFYFDLSLIVRGYIEGRYETPAVESTTYELENSEVLKDLPGNHYRRLFDFFSRADMVKFAKSIPTSKDAEVDLSFAYQFVLDTKPAPIDQAVADQPAEEVKA